MDRLANIKAVIYDLDGTLTDTLTDLACSTNYALRQCGFPLRSIEEVRARVGNGIGRLIELAVPHDCSRSDMERCLAVFKEHYMLHCKDNTCLYDGVEAMMREIKRRGYRTAIVSNKVQSGVDELCHQFFVGLADVAIGERPGVPRKPAADMVNMAIAALDCKKEDCVYIGDSEVDIATARNSDLPCISVLWGFRDKATLEKAGATIFASTPQDVLRYLPAKSKLL